MSVSLVTPQFSKSVDSHVRQRGFEYFRNGHVRLISGDELQCSADVMGTTRYEVDIAVDDFSKGRVYCNCTCPFVAENNEPCKHIWATILAAEQKGWLRGGKTSPRELVIDDSQLSRSEFGTIVESLIGNNRRKKNPRATGKQQQPKRPPVPAWKKQLEAVPAQVDRDYANDADDWNGRKEILYVFDPAALHNSELFVMVMHRERKRDGTWSKPKNGMPSRDQVARLASADDRFVMTAFNGAQDSYSYGVYGGSRFILRQAQREFLLPRMAATGRCLIKDAATGEYRPIQWDGPEPWQFRVDLRRDRSNNIVLTGLFVRGAESMPITKPQLVSHAGVFFGTDSLSVFDDSGAWNWLVFFRRMNELTVPAADFDAFLAAAFTKSVLPPWQLPDDLALKETYETAQPVFQIRKAERMWGSQGELQGLLSFRYGDRLIDSNNRGRMEFDAAQRTVLHRDNAAEKAAVKRLREIGIHHDRYGSTAFRLQAKRLPEIVRTLVKDGWQVEAEGQLYRTAGKLDLHVRSGIDWFELHGTVDFDGTAVALPKILEAIRRNQTTIALDDGHVGMLPEAWLKKYGLLAGVGEAEKDHIRFGQCQVGLLDALLAAQPEARFDETFNNAREQLRTFAGVKAAEPPAAFRGTLRPYQGDGLGWLKFLRQFGFGGCLADDMGLGKTVQVLAMLTDRAATRPKGEPRTSLVVVPKSLVFNWKQEAARFAPELKVLDHTGTERSKDAAIVTQHDLVLTTYGTLRNDAALLKDIDFDYCILDESQAVKNADTESAKAVRLLRGRHRLAMSGTPIENHLGELWSLFDFLNPGMLGGTAAFKAIGGAGRSPDPESRNLLAQALRPFILRRTKDQVAKDLPQKTEKTVYCDLDPKQRKIYDELREYYRQALLTRVDTMGLAKSKIMVLEALLRLRQAACHPGLLDKLKADDSSAKLDLLLPQLREVFEEGHKALVFSQFTSFLSIVKKKLDASGIPYEYLDGKTRDRQARVDSFQTDPKCQLFLISLKAGGLGLNLTAAEYVFLLDPWWNPAVEAQAIDRAHRIGQTRPVMAYRLIARDTVEEKVLALQATKRDLADAIINADNSLIRGLTREDLQLLLS